MSCDTVTTCTFISARLAMALSVGSSAMHGAHHVAHRLTSNGLPLRLFNRSLCPSGSLSVISGSALPLWLRSSVPTDSPLLAGAVCLLTAGCQTYQQQNRAIYQNWQQGNLTNAVIGATKMAESKTNSLDAIIWRLEQATVLRANGQYEDSNKAFDRAQEKIDDYAQRAKVSVSSEAAALMSNQANLPYEGRSYDGIMLNTYKVLNYLQLGEPERARPEIIREIGRASCRGRV